MQSWTGGACTVAVSLDGGCNGGCDGVATVAEPLNVAVLFEQWTTSRRALLLQGKLLRQAIRRHEDVSAARRRQCDKELRCLNAFTHLKEGPCNHALMLPLAVSDKFT